MNTKDFISERDSLRKKLEIDLKKLYKTEEIDMSITLMWKPITKESRSLPDGLKRAISRRLFETDGIAVMRESDIPYLEGLRDAGINEAEELIDIILKHEHIEIFLEV